MLGGLYCRLWYSYLYVLLCYLLRCLITANIVIIYPSSSEYSWHMRDSYFAQALVMGALTLNPRNDLLFGLAPDHLRKILGSSIHTSPCLFSYDIKFPHRGVQYRLCILQLAGTVSIRAHLDADVNPPNWLELLSSLSTAVGPRDLPSS